MISRLELTNFVLVQNLTIDFSEGLQILSGETGAGKSIIVGAVDLIFGGKVKPGIHLDETSSSILELTVPYDSSNSILKNLITEYDIDVSENELFFRREIAVDKKGRIFLNGRRISLKTVSEFRSALLDFHSQRDQQKLFDLEYQLEIVDSFGDLLNDREDYSEKFRDLVKNLELQEKLTREEDEKRNRIELYRYQVEELDAMDIKQNEDTELERELNILNHAEEILELVTSLNTAFYESEDSIHDLVNNFLFRFTKHENDNDRIGEVVSALKDSLAGIEDTVRSSQSILNVISVDKELLDRTIDRLNEINRIKSKYKLDLDGILEYREKIRQEIDNFSSRKEEVSILRKKIEQDSKEVRSFAEKLSLKRKKKAGKLEAEIKKNMKKLAIPNAEVEIRFSIVAEKNERFTEMEGLNETGMDQVNFFFSANKGIKVQPLSLTASGGELSRFLLAVKKIISQDLDKRTIVLDEIDSGIGGTTAELLGSFIHEISDVHQVICITHLAQIAAYGDLHFAIRKNDKTGSERLEVKTLNEEKRKIEIARMVSGKQTEAALRHAEEILKKKDKTHDIN